MLFSPVNLPNARFKSDVVMAFFDGTEHITGNFVFKIQDSIFFIKLNTFFGGHYYSFVTREYLLNLILFYREAHGQFPQGAVCIVERWAWQGEAFKRAGRWVVGWFWRFIRREDFKSPGFWVHLPSVQGFDQSAVTKQST